MESTNTNYPYAGAPESESARPVEDVEELSVGDRISLDVSGCTGTLRLDSWPGDALQVVSLPEQRAKVERRPEAMTGGAPGAEVIALVGHDCRVRVPGSTTVEVAGVHDRVLLVVGSGVAASVRARAGAEPEGAGPPPGDWADEFARAMADLGRQLEAQLGEWAPRFGQQVLESLRSVRWQPERWRHMAHRASGDADEWARRAEERARRVEERATAYSMRAEEVARRTAERLAARVQREVERAEERARREFGRGVTVAGRAHRPTGPGGPGANAAGADRAARAAATSEERLAVLRMLRDGKITPAQAAELLAALGE